jgi:DNA-binding Lrp family transcriptional regulator
LSNPISINWTVVDTLSYDSLVRMESKLQEESATLEFQSEPLDVEIIRALQEDARSSYRDIARKLKISVGTVHSRVTKLEEAKVIRGFSVDVNYSKLGFGITALILLQAKGKHLRDVEARLTKFPNVCVVYDITGDFDIALVGKFESTLFMDKFIKEVLSMDFVERAVTSIVLNSLKESFNIKL